MCEILPGSLCRLGFVTPVGSTIQRRNLDYQCDNHELAGERFESRKPRIYDFHSFAQRKWMYPIYFCVLHVILYPSH